MCHTKATWSGFIDYRETQTLFGVLIEGPDEVDVHPLLLSQDAHSAELPPFVGGEVGADLGVAPRPAKPLYEVQVVGLQQPFRDLDKARVTRQPGLRIGM